MQKIISPFIVILHISVVFGVGICCPLHAYDKGVNQRALDSLTHILHEQEDSPPCVAKARLLRSYGLAAGRLGRTEEAQEYAQQAYDMFMLFDEYGWASCCLYERCIAYNSIGDTLHLAALLTQLADLAAHDTSALTQYNYYAILFTYEAIQENVEAATAAGRQSIYYMEQIANAEQYNIMPVWNYYNQAVAYDLLYEPEDETASRPQWQIDSIEKYLDLAERSAEKRKIRLDRDEAMISIGDERAWLCYYRGDFTGAEKTMQNVLRLIDTVAIGSPGSVITERGEAFAFFVELYSSQARYAEALHYQQLLTDNNRERYNIERQQVLDEVQTRYEVAEQRLALVEQQNRLRTTRWILALTLIFLIALAAALLAVIYRKREAEEELYAKALEAEQALNELEQLRNIGNTDHLQLIRDNLLKQVSALSPKVPFRSDAITRINSLELTQFAQALTGAEGLSIMDKRYLMCFAVGLSAEQVADIFSISPASVYTVRYRIRKKFSKDLPFTW